MSAFWGARATRTKCGNYRTKKEEKINPKVFFETLFLAAGVLASGTLFLLMLLYFI